jgi:deoxyribonuclease V
LVKKAVYISDLKVPYITGFLSFREAPVMLRAVRLLGKLPDIIMVDGNGIAHPRRMGLATYIGVILNARTVGCAKNPIYSFFMPGGKRGEHTLYYDPNGSKVGYCLRTQNQIKPVFVSPGNKIGFERARDLVLSCSRYRIPEPLRQADIWARKMMKNV